MTMDRQFVLLLITTAAFFAAGCKSWGETRNPLTPWKTNSPAAPRPAYPVQQATYLEEAPVAKEGWEWKDFSPQNLGKTFKRVTGRGPNPAYAKQRYADAEAIYTQAVEARTRDPEGDHEAQFANAATLYREAADRWPDSALEQDALFRAGECFFFSDQYPKADESYALLIKHFENSKYLEVVEARRFMIAQYWHDANQAKPHRFMMYNFFDKTRPGLDTGGHALRVWDRMRLDDPTGKLADDATLAAANAHFLAGRYMEADEFYTDLRKTFPSSEHQFTAHYLGLKAKMLSYQGAQYSGVALNEAEKLIIQMRKQFPSDAAREQEFLERAFAEVRYKQAEREWQQGQFYDGRAEYRAARMYYQTIVEKYAETPFGERARERIEQTRSLPEVPPQRLSWLVNLFPAKEQVKPLIPSDDLPTKRR